MPTKTLSFKMNKEFMHSVGTILSIFKLQAL